MLKFNSDAWLVAVISTIDKKKRTSKLVMKKKKKRPTIGTILK